MDSPVFSKDTGKAHCLKLSMDSAVCSKMDHCLENGGHGLVFLKGSGEVTVGVAAVSAWLGGVHKHGGAYSHNDISNQTHCKQQTTQLHATAPGYNKKLCTNLNEGHVLQPQFSAHGWTANPIAICSVSQCYLPNPCVYQCVKLHQNTFSTCCTCPYEQLD